MDRQYQIHTEPVSTLPETVTLSRWMQPLSEPVRFNRDKRKAIALIASGMVIDPWLLTQPEQITLSRWMLPLSEPRRFKKRLPEFDQKEFFWSYFIVPPVMATWFEPLSEPKRFPKQLDIRNQPVTVLGIPPIITLDRYYMALSEPRRYPRHVINYGFPQSHVATAPSTFTAKFTIDGASSERTIYGKAYDVTFTIIKNIPEEIIQGKASDRTIDGASSEQYLTITLGLT